ncbi:hypothetical protein COU91_02990 [Candidatus Saccharibacteria bacterium CG10_big_fil_rev_8_21_14_0_10_47_8]|nr:MAG: hypothetical protein COU91_02990 [Candidatus Saccharibacteria bacterium CG10_big_fil_rev_8_21_14_0_10_47_8]
MQNHPGIFIVIEGSDGSGKTTQFNLLKERLEAVGYDVEVFKFPQYDQDSSHFVRRYLNGDYGPASDINPYTASLFYALDRFEGAPRIRKALEASKVVLSDRYAGANMAHQGSKFASAAEKRGFFIWADSMEFQLLGIPRPNINIYLRVPAEVSFELIAKRAARSYTDKTHDEHEADINHLKQAVETYDLLCQLFPKDFYAVDCTDGGQMLSIPTINDHIWQYLQPFLSSMPKHQPHSKTVRLSGPPIPESQDNRGPGITNFDIDIQGQPLKIKLNHLSLLAARNLVATMGIDAQLRLSKKTAVYEPKLHSQQLLKRYRQIMAETIARHQLMLKLLQKSNKTNSKPTGVLLAATPLAYFCDVDIRGESSALQKLIIEMSDSKLAELGMISQTLYSSAHKKRPNDFKTPEIQKLKQVFSDNTNNMVGKLPQTLGNPDTLLRLIAARPRNEFDLINDAVYKNSSLDRSEVLSAIDNLSYELKTELLKHYFEALESEPSTAQAISYEWEMLASGVTLDYLLRNRLLDRVILQSATPRYGYEVPDWVSSAGIEELFTECFDDSLTLFSELQSGGHEEEAQYAVLMGHRLRWQVTMSLNKILRFKVLTGDSNCPAEAKSLYESMQLAISQTHPLIGEWLIAQETPRQLRTATTPKVNRAARHQKKHPKKPTQDNL